jgi:hypothetical protein
MASLFGNNIAHIADEGARDLGAALRVNTMLATLMYGWPGMLVWRWDVG